MKLQALLSSKWFWLSLTILAAIILHYHSLDFQLLLSTGDHGRDLYAAAHTLDGKLPYRDYWWVYGPLMPFYYAAFFAWLGISIPSILFGKFLLNLIAFIFFYLSLSQIIPYAIAFLGALWFMAFWSDFFFTFNHIGGIAILMAIIYGLLSYFKYQRSWALTLIPICCGLLMLIKINFGIIAWAISLSSIWLIDKFNQTKPTKEKSIFYIVTALGVPFIVGGIYFALLHDLPLYYIRQCLPYLEGDHPYNISLLTGLKLLFQTQAAFIWSSLYLIFFSFLIVACLIKLIVDIYKKKFNKTDFIALSFAIGTCGLFYTLNLHEFITSGVMYRKLWAEPFGVMLIFIIIGYTLINMKRIIKIVFMVAIISFIIPLGWNGFHAVSKIKQTPNYLNMPYAKVYTSNEPAWINTVSQNVQFLNENLNKDELFFALPYDCLYYYLTGKPSPTELLIFFQHINIPPEQEERIINTLQSKNINWIVVSSRIISGEEGNGIFGQTHCVKLGKYIKDNFEIAAEFGEWSRPAGWATNHATRILKRKVNP